MSQRHPALRANGYYIDPVFHGRQPLRRRPAAGHPGFAAKPVLGGEAEMWSEFADSVLYESRVWPARRRRGRAPLEPRRPEPGRARYVPPPGLRERASWRPWACATAAPRLPCCASWPRPTRPPCPPCKPWPRC
ncbi:MAG: hypothetical protein WKG07_09575 [Hymenobacter sp.]